MLTLFAVERSAVAICYLVRHNLLEKGHYYSMSFSNFKRYPPKQCHLSRSTCTSKRSPNITKDLLNRMKTLLGSIQLGMLCQKHKLSTSVSGKSMKTGYGSLQYTQCTQTQQGQQVRQTWFLLTKNSATTEQPSAGRP